MAKGLATMGTTEHRTCSPLVSVIMTSYNGEKYIGSAIDSVLCQSLKDFELIVVDDCSNDATPTILSGIYDPRLRLIHNEQHEGIANSLNRAVEVAAGKYVAFQDHDDLSLPDRLQIQCQFLDENPEIGMVGSSCRIIDADGNLVRDAIVRCNDAELRWCLIWYNPFFHTTLMARRSAITKIRGYSSDPNYRFSEDYEMMSRVAMSYPVANLPQPLACWRTHANSASERNAIRQLCSGANISVRNVADLWRRIAERTSNETAAQAYQAMWSFQFPPRPGQEPASQEQMLRAPEYLKLLECEFSSTATGVNQVGRIRATRYYRWSRRAVALALRENLALKNRIALLIDAMNLLWFAVKIR
jgi:hypothetical protein